MTTKLHSRQWKPFTTNPHGYLKASAHRMLDAIRDGKTYEPMWIPAEVKKMPVEERIDWCLRVTGDLP